MLVVMEEGQSVGYAMDKLQDRGQFFINPGADVYEGMIAGREQPRERHGHERMQGKKADEYEGVGFG